MKIGPCVCLSPSTIYTLVGTLFLPSSHFDTALLNCWIFVAYTHWHTYSDTDFSVLVNEPWLMWMLLVTVGTADVLVPRTCNDTHTLAHTHPRLTPGNMLISLHSVSCVPQGHMPHLPQCSPATYTRVNLPLLMSNNLFFSPFMSQIFSHW